LSSADPVTRIFLMQLNCIRHTMPRLLC
jgi:hypothetical protein